MRRATGDAAWSTSSSWMSEVSRAAVLARIVATPSSRFSSSARAASVSVGVGLHPRALLADEERDHLELDAVGGAELAALGLGLDLAHLAREDRDDGCFVVATSGRGPPAPLCGGCRGRHAPPERVCRNPPAMTGRNRRGCVLRGRLVAVTNAGWDASATGRGHSLLRAATSAAGSPGLSLAASRRNQPQSVGDDVFGVALGREVDPSRSTPSRRRGRSATRRG